MRLLERLTGAAALLVALALAAWTWRAEPSPERPARDPDDPASAFCHLQVAEVLPGSQADRKGVREGDFLLACDGKSLRVWKDLTGRLQEATATGRSVRIVLQSRGIRRELEMAPGILGVRVVEVE